MNPKEISFKRKFFMQQMEMFAEMYNSSSREVDDFEEEYDPYKDEVERTR